VIIVDNRVKSWKGKTMEKLVKLMEPYSLMRAPIDEACLEIEEFILSHPTLIGAEASTLSQ
jgi:ATP-dependent DNA helicase DinG